MKTSSRLTLAALFLGLFATAAPAQFISELRISGRPVPRGTPGILIDLHQVETTVTDAVATTKVVQVFRNPNGRELEGTYFFPIPEQAAVGDFAMEMAGKMVKGEVLEKDKAAAIYQSIVQRRKDPGLLEYVGRRLFRARVFPIPARGTTRVELSYSQPLTPDGKTVEYRYPFRTRGVNGSPVGKASFRMTIKSKDPIRTVYSPSHQVEVTKKGDHEATVGFETSQDPGDRDLVAIYGLSKEPVGATLFSHGERDDSGAFLLLLAPGSEVGKDQIVAKDVLFVVDTSGSMAGEKLEQTKKALSYCINSLNEKDRFNVIPFSTEARPLNPGLVPFDAKHKKDALDFVREMRAVGGTNINDALVQALGMSRDADRPLMVIFMTDGEPTIGVTHNQGILANVKTANKALTRLFVFGVGEDVRTELLDQLAEDNHGTRDYVGKKEDIEVKISSFFEKVSSPVLSDIKVTVSGGIRVTDVHPKKLPDLFRGGQLLMTGRFTGEGTGVITLEGKVNGTPKTLTFEKKFARGGKETAFVPRLWAVRKVGYLMDQIRLNGEKKELKDEVVRLGKTYGIVTPYTSYLVLEDEPVARGGRRNLRRVDRFRRGYHGPAGGGRFGAQPSTGGGAGGQAGSGPVRPGGRAVPNPSTSTSTRRDVAGVAPQPDPARSPVGGRRGGGNQPQAETGSTADDFLRDALKLSEEEKRKQPTAKVGYKVAGDKAFDGREVPKPRDAANRSVDKDEADALRFSAGADRRARAIERSKRKALDELAQTYAFSAVNLSKKVKSLREASTANESGAGLVVRRVGNRTFYHRYGLYVESPILDMKSADIRKKVVKIEAFSAAYFALLAKQPDLGAVFALGERLLFKDGDRIVQIVPAAPAKESPKKSPNK